ncbi:MAG: twin-arginine translocase TatA/TatE family subunit [Nitrososphaerales archaeon]
MLTELSLMIGGSEWIVIILLAMFLLFGAKKLPEVSKSLGKVMGEYQRAKNTVKGEVDKASRSMNTSPFKLDGTSSTASKNVSGTSTEVKVDPTSTGITGPVGSEREKLEVIARTLEIEPSGKSTEELKQLISGKMNQ